MFRMPADNFSLMTADASTMNVHTVSKNPASSSLFTLSLSSTSVKPLSSNTQNIHSIGGNDNGNGGINSKSNWNSNDESSINLGEKRTRNVQGLDKPSHWNKGVINIMHMIAHPILSVTILLSYYLTILLT